MLELVFGSKQRGVCRKASGFVPSPGQSLEAFFAELHETSGHMYQRWIKAIYGSAQLVYCKGIFPDVPVKGKDGEIKPPSDAKVLEFICSQGTFFKRWAEAKVAGDVELTAEIWQEGVRACKNPIAYQTSADNISEAVYTKVKEAQSTAANRYVQTHLGKSAVADDTTEA